MKRTRSRLALRADTLRTLRSADLTRAAGGAQCYTISALVCPDTWCASCAGATCVSCDCVGTD